MLTERTCGIRSVRSRRPFGSTSRTIADCDTGCVLRAAVAGTRLSADRGISRKPLTDMELEERAIIARAPSPSQLETGCYNRVLASYRKRER